MVECLIAVGSNLGDRSESLSEAVAILSQSAHFQNVTHSAWRETAPVGGPDDQPVYLNGAIRLRTTLAPQQVLIELQAIETRLGRHRDVRWGPRTLDLDLLLYGSVTLSTPELTLPHPRMAFRKFVLQPAAEIAPELVHPLIGWTIAQLHEHLARAIPYVAIAGAAGVGKSRLAAELAAAWQGRLVTDARINPPRVAQASAGPRLSPEIEWLERREPLVRRADWPDPQRWAFSDFWLEQSLAYATVELATRAAGAENQRLSAAEWSEVVAAWGRARLLTMPPKLLILLDPPDHVADPVQRNIAARATQPQIGPLLRLASADPAANFAEATAAIAAMQ